MGLWTREEAYNYLNERYHMDMIPNPQREEMIVGLMKMEHRPWCRTNLAGSLMNYNSDCTCDG